MAIRPFLFTDTISLGANASGDAVLPVSSGEIGRIRRLVFSASGAFSITGLKDSTGLAYSNTQVSDPIPSTALVDAGADLAGIQHLEPALELEGPNQLTLTILDTSGSANTVRVIAEGEKEV